MPKEKTTNHPRASFLLGGFALLLIVVMGLHSPFARAAIGNIFGFAWSGTSSLDGAYTGMGWLSLNSQSDNAPVDYGVTIPPSSGNLMGYAWNPYYGWISFEATDLIGCPSGPCVAGRQGSILTGWARILSVRDNSTLFGSLDDAGGWSGWVSLSGTASDGSSYGVQVSGQNLSGYAWSDELGWIDFSGVSFSSTPGGTITSFVANPSTISATQSSTLTWSSTNTTECHATASSFPTNGATSNLIGVPVSPQTTSTYQLACTDINGVPLVKNVTVYVLSPQVSLTAVPSRVKQSNNTTLTWSSSDVTNCTLNDSNGALLSSNGSGSMDVPVVSQTTFTLTCDTLTQSNTAGPPISKSVIVNVASNYGNY